MVRNKGGTAFQADYPLKCLMNLPELKDEEPESNTAEEHAEWYANHFKKIVKLVYKDAFNHGMKHGRDK